MQTSLVFCSLELGSSSGCARDRQGSLVRLSEGPGGTHAHRGLLFQPAEGQAWHRLLPPLHCWPTLQTERLTQAQRTQTSQIVRLIPFPLQMEGETEAQRVGSSCLGSHSMFAREPGPQPRTDVHQLCEFQARFRFICPSPLSASPLLLLIEASVSLEPEKI